MGVYSIAVGALWEVWSQSFSSLFVSPLRMKEYVLGQILFGLVKQSGVFLILSTVAYFAFNFWIWQLGWMLLVYALLLAIFSWAFGMFVLGLILRFGTTIQSLSWGLVSILQPIVAVYFPVEIVPSQLRWISYSLPPTYVFESARMQMLTGSARLNLLLDAFVLDVVYLAVSVLFLHSMWAAAKKTGVIVRMEQ
jgi:ABC-2 type transport system permease protein